MIKNHCPLLYMQWDISWLLLSIFPLSQPCPVLQGVAHKIETGGKKQRQFNRTGLTSCPKGGEVKKTKRDNVKRFFRTLRLFPYWDTGGEEAQPCHYRCRYFPTPPALRTTSPIFCVAKHRGGVCESSTIPQGIDEGVKGHSPFEMKE